MQLSQSNLWQLGLLIPLLIALLSIPASSLIQGISATKMVEYEGIERSYLLYSSEPREGQSKQPLIIALHDDGSTAKNLVRISQGRLNKLADENGYVLVYPEGRKKQWRLGVPSESTSLYSEDVGFIKKMVEALEKEFVLDKERIFIVGMGSGGVMAFQMACEVPGMFRAVGVVTGAMQDTTAENCTRASKTSLLVMNGTENPILPYDGGTMLTRSARSVRVLSTDESVANWLKNNGCLFHAEEHLIPDQDMRDGTSVAQYTYSGCEEDVQVVLYKIDGGGHTWPGGRQYSKQERIGRTTRDIDASEKIWDFLATF